ncbi:MAG TPA: hypothetical protein VF753_19265 [Terriglobales bacterium]
MACAQDTLPDSPRAASSRVDPDGVISPARPDTGTALVVATPPTAPAESTHAFWDTTNIFLFSGVAVVRTMDYVSTQNFLRRGRQEILLPQDVVENHAGFAAIEAAGTATSIGISYLFHRTQHHTMERWVSIVHISVTGFGDVRNYCLKSKHTEQQ